MGNNDKKLTLWYLNEAYLLNMGVLVVRGAPSLYQWLGRLGVTPWRESISFYKRSMAGVYRGRGVSVGPNTLMRGAWTGTDQL
jgi:hypothetical protein